MKDLQAFLKSNNLHIALNALWVVASAFAQAYKPGAGAAGQVSTVLAIVNLLTHISEGKAA